ncbi:MAG: signal peptidase I [Candidatus Poribacteria bacterium]
MLKTIQWPKLWYKCYAQKPEAWLHVFKSSMSPMIQVGDKVLVKQVEPEQIFFGDIIVFKEDDNRLCRVLRTRPKYLRESVSPLWITHRVIGKRMDDRNIIFLHKGDRDTFAKSIFSKSLIGKVTCIKKEDKHIRLDSIWGRLLNLLLGVKSYLLYLLCQHNLGSKLTRLYRRYGESDCNLQRISKMA